MSAARLLFVSLTNDVGSDRIVSELGRHGAACAVLGPAGNFASLNRCVEHTFAVPRSFGSWGTMRAFKPRLARAVRDWHPDRIVPVDELAALLLRTIAGMKETGHIVRQVLLRSFGDEAGYHAACHRLPLMEVARRAGVRTPVFGPVPDGLTFPIVVKRDHSSGSGGVVIASNAIRLRSALRKAAILRAIKRGMAWSAGYDHGPGPVLLQQFVPGTLAMRTVVTDRGRVLDGVSFRAVQSHPEKRASTILEPIDCAAMDVAARKLVAALGCSGFVSFDFIRDPDGAAYLLEMNPRPIGSTHLGRFFGHDLAKAYLTGEAAPSEEGQRQSPAWRSVALFPKELERDPSGDLIDAEPGRRHDLPRDEPRVLQAYADHLIALHPTSEDTIRRRTGTVTTTREPETPRQGPQLSRANP